MIKEGDKEEWSYRPAKQDPQIRESAQEIYDIVNDGEELSPEEEEEMLGLYFADKVENADRPLPAGFEAKVRDTYKILKLGW